jgi:hypothetical protein
VDFTQGRGEKSVGRKREALSATSPFGEFSLCSHYVGVSFIHQAIDHRSQQQFLVSTDSEYPYLVKRLSFCRSRWLRGLSRGFAAARLLGLRVRKKIPPGAWMSVSCECCLFSGRGLCVGLIARPEESYRVWCV